MYILIIYDRILILQNYGILEIPCSIPLFRIGIPNLQKKKNYGKFRLSVSVVSISGRLFFRCLVTALSILIRESIQLYNSI